MPYKCTRCGYSPSGKERSNPQNKYYWSVCIGIISEHTGFTPEETHEILKYKFLKDGKLIKHRNGNIYTEFFTKSTAQLDTKEFEEYLSQIRIWASSDLGAYIPSPNEALNETN